MSAYNLSIVLPGIRTQNWGALYRSAAESVGSQFTWEMIIVGPNPPPVPNTPDNFKFIKDFGAPARAAQRGVGIAQGEYMTWASDDGVFLPNALAECLHLIIPKDRCDAITIRYREGGNFPPNQYWDAHHHADLRLPGVPDHYQIAPVAMYKTEYFKELGGWDCRFEHLNMCCHDLAFRVQNDGGYFYLSPTEVMSCTWDVNTVEYQPIRRAYEENDAPLFKEMYSQDQSERLIIPFDNWKDSPEVWEKRFGIG